MDCGSGRLAVAYPAYWARSATAFPAVAVASPAATCCGALCRSRSLALALRDTSPQRVHQIDDTGRCHSRRFGFLGQAGLFPLQKLDHRALITILEFRGIELS